MSSGLGAFMDGAMKGAQVGGWAVGKRRENSDAKIKAQEAERIATANQMETDRQIAVMDQQAAARNGGGAIPVNEAPRGPAAPEAEAAIPTLTQEMQPATAPTSNPLLEAGKGILEKAQASATMGEGELKSDRKYDPQQAMPEKGETAPAATPTPTKATKASTDGATSSPNGEPKLTTKELSTNPSVQITSDNTPSLLDGQDARIKAGLKALPNGATAKERLAVTDAASEQTRETAMATLSKSSSMIKAASTMPEGPDKVKAMNVIRMQLAQAWDVIPNGMSARVEYIPASGDAKEKWVLQQYSSENPEVKLGQFIMSEESIDGMINTFDGPEGARAWADYSPELMKNKQEVRAADQKYEHDEVKLKSDMLDKAVEHEIAIQNANSTSLNAQTAANTAYMKQIAPVMYGGYDSLKSQNTGVDNMMKYIKANLEDRGNNIRDTANRGALGDVQGSDGLVFGDNDPTDVKDPRPQAADTSLLKPTGDPYLDALYNSRSKQTTYQKMAEWRRGDINIVDGKLLERGGFYDDAIRRGQAAGDEHKFIKQNKGSGRTQIYDDDGNVLTDYATPRNDMPVSQSKKILTQQAGGAQRIKSMGLKVVTIKLPDGTLMPKLAPIGYTEADAKKDMATQKEQQEAATRREKGGQLAEEVPGGATGQVAQAGDGQGIPAPGDPAPAGNASQAVISAISGADADAGAGVGNQVTADPAGLQSPPGLYDEQTGILNQREADPATRPVADAQGRQQAGGYTGQPNPTTPVRTNESMLGGAQAPGGYTGAPGPNQPVRVNQPLSPGNQVPGGNTGAPGVGQPVRVDGDQAYSNTGSGQAIPDQYQPSSTSRPGKAEYDRMPQPQLNEAREGIMMSIAQDIGQGQITPAIAAMYMRQIGAMGNRGMSQEQANGISALVQYFQKNNLLSGMR